MEWVKGLPLAAAARQITTMEAQRTLSLAKREQRGYGAPMKKNRKLRWITIAGLLLGMVGAGTLFGCNTQSPPVQNRTAYVADTSQNSLLPYNVNSTTGALTPLPGAPIAANCNGPVAFAITPSQHFLYVPCAQGNTFSGFAVNQNPGGLTAAGTFMSDNNPFAAAIDAGGKFLYIANSGGNSVTGYSINVTTGAVSAIAGARVTTNFAPNGLAIDPSGAFLFVSTASGNSGDLEGFSINSASGPASGALTPLAGSPFASFLATAVKASPSGKYVYAADETSGVRAFSLNAMSGALTQIAGSPFPAGNEPFGIAMDPAGKFLYTGNFVSNDVSAYTIDAASGKLAAIAGSPFPVGTGPGRLVVDTTGKFVYVPSSFDNTVWGFTIDGATGSLTHMAGSPFMANGAADVVAIP
jgi:6-phosphogluconolactonase